MMSLFMNLSLKWKVYGVTAVYQVLFLFITGLGIIGLTQMEETLVGLRSVYENGGERVGRIANSLLRVRNFTIQIVNAREEAQIAQNYQFIFVQWNLVHSEIRSIQTFIKIQEKSYPEERIHLDKLSKRIIDLERQFDQDKDLVNTILIYKTDSIRKNEEAKNKLAFETQLRITPSNLGMIASLESIEKAFQTLTNLRKESIDSIANKVKYVLIGGYLVAFFLGLILTLTLVRGILQPISKAEHLAYKIADGDLTVRETVRSKDEIGRLVNALNGACENLKGLIQKIGNSADNVASSSEEMSITSQTVADGASDQAAALEQTAAAVTELIESINQVAQSSKDQATESKSTATEMSKLMESIRNVASNSRLIKENSDTMLKDAEAGKGQIEETVVKMEAISESSEQIKDITVVINEIADQTNLLALNAAIEAARAGDTGRGFAVVAEEISKLATRSQEATKQIEELISYSLERVSDGRNTIEKLVSIFKRFLLQSKEATKASDLIFASSQEQISQSEKALISVTNLTNLANFIAEATKEQENSSKEIASAIEQVNGISQNNAAASEEMASSTMNLTKLSEKLNDLISNFRIQ